MAVGAEGRIVELRHRRVESRIEGPAPMPHPDTRVALQFEVKLLLGEFPTLPKEDVIREIEAAATALLASARLADFVPILAYRSARDHLSQRIRERENTPAR
jgi:hypothetical protein